MVAREGAAVVVEVDRLDSLCFEVGRGGVDFRGGFQLW